MSAPDEHEEFCERVQRIVARFCAQNGAVDEARDSARLADALWTLIQERGLPSPETASAGGPVGEMDKRDVAELTARVLASVSGGEVLADAAKQIVKACFYPEFRVCRDSYRERSSKGVCKRQVLEKARGRVSGAHCVDCPYWTDVSPERHAALLAESWCGDAAEFTANRAVFLPEDFRALRTWVREAAGRGR